jgi:hypothetical protein
MLNLWGKKKERMAEAATAKKPWIEERIQPTKGCKLFLLLVDDMCTHM